mmetsp:Transcript_1357/g.2858  ORF Transcript_1357/g.2858 Transcript_1357/m.2858 type:complete len:105 (+) Transcript_1357:535-849(+)
MHTLHGDCIFSRVFRSNIKVRFLPSGDDCIKVNGPGNVRKEKTTLCTTVLRISDYDSEVIMCTINKVKNVSIKKYASCFVLSCIKNVELIAHDLREKVHFFVQF